MPFKRVGFGALLGAALCVCTVLSSEPSRSAPGLTEVELKAVFLLRLPQFVSWPDQRPAAHFCVDPSSEVSALLSEMVASEPRGRTVRTIETGDTEGCDVVYGILRLPGQVSLSRSGSVTSQGSRKTVAWWNSSDAAHAWGLS